MIKKAHWIALGMGITILLAFWYYSSLRFQNSLNSFLDRDSEAYRNYQEYSKLFPSSGNNTWVVLLDFPSEPKYADFLRVDSLTDVLAQVKGVDRCYSVTSLRLLQRSLNGIAHKKVLKLNNEAAFARSWEKLPRYPDVHEKFISSDRKATCIYLEIDSLASESLAEHVRRKVDEFHFPAVYFAGSSLFTQAARETMQQEMKFLSTVAAAVLLCLLLLLYRSLKSLVLTAFTLAFNVSGIYLLFVITGHEVNALTFTVPMLICILSFSDLVHILYSAGQHDASQNWETHVRQSLHALRIPLGLTSFTTALAFAVFLFSSVPEIVDFSWMSCFGIVLAYLSARYLFPELLIAVGKINRPIEIFNFLNRSIARSLGYSKIVRRLGVLLVMLLSVFSIMQAKISYDPYRNGSEELMAGQVVLNERFGGLRSVEVMLSSVQVLDSTTFRKVEEIEKYLREEYGCSSVFSINTVARRLHRFRNYGFASFYALPDRFDADFMKKFERYKSDLGLREAVGEDGHTLKIVGRLRENGSYAARAKTEKLENWLKARQWPGKIYVGGHSLLLDQTMHRVTSIILIGVFLSLLMAACVGGLFYRKWRLAIALLLPNALPLLCALSCMEIFQLSLDPFTAMSLSIIFGLSIDDTIYITGTYMEKRKTVESISESIRWNLFPVCATSLLLAIGFGIFALSDLPSTQSIGVLIPIILLVAVLSDLFLLPALLKWAVKKSN